MQTVQRRAGTEAGNIMNTSRSSVLPLTAIAFLYTPREWLSMFGIVEALEILEASRVAKCRREVLVQGELKP